MDKFCKKIYEMIPFIPLYLPKWMPKLRLNLFFQKFGLTKLLS